MVKKLVIVVGLLKNMSYVVLNILRYIASAASAFLIFFTNSTFYTMHVTNFTLLNININYINKCYITLEEIYKNTCDV